MVVPGTSAADDLIAEARPAGPVERPGPRILIKGAGEIASGIAHRLYAAGFKVCLTEVAEPLAVSRGVAFSEAVFDGTKTIMSVTAVLVPARIGDIERAWEQGKVPLVVDPSASIRDSLHPDVLVDATMAKRRTDTRLSDAPTVIGVGPGFLVGRDARLVVETTNNANLGKVITTGEAEANNGIPVRLGGLSLKRIVWAPVDGIFTSRNEIGDTVSSGQVIGQIGETVLHAPLDGMLRGLIRSGVAVPKGAKLAEVDPVNDSRICTLITDKARAIGEGVLKAIELRYS